MTQQEIDSTNEEIANIAKLADRVAALMTGGESAAEEDLGKLSDAADWLDAEAAVYTDAADELTALADECEHLRERVKDLLDRDA